MDGKKEMTPFVLGSASPQTVVLNVPVRPSVKHLSKKERDRSMKYRQLSLRGMRISYQYTPYFLCPYTQKLTTNHIILFKDDKNSGFGVGVHLRRSQKFSAGIPDLLLEGFFQ